MGEITYEIETNDGIKENLIKEIKISELNNFENGIKNEVSRLIENKRNYEKTQILIMAKIANDLNLNLAKQESQNGNENGASNLVGKT